MPPDRLFGMVEKVYKTKQQILTLQEYYNILEQFGTVKILGKDWNVVNYKKVLRPSLRQFYQLNLTKGICLQEHKNTYTCSFSKEHQTQKC